MKEGTKNKIKKEKKSRFPCCKLTVYWYVWELCRLNNKLLWAGSEVFWGCVLQILKLQWRQQKRNRYTALHFSKMLHLKSDKAPRWWLSHLNHKTGRFAQSSSSPTTFRRIKWIKTLGKKKEDNSRDLAALEIGGTQQPKCADCVREPTRSVCALTWPPSVPASLHPNLCRQLLGAIPKNRATPGPGNRSQVTGLTLFPPWVKPP